MPKRKRDGQWAEFTVEGDGLFPFDMLRYDHCWPKSEAHDSTALGGGHDRELRRVVLVTGSAAAPTPNRWKSFGWRFIGYGELRDPTTHPARET